MTLLEHLKEAARHLKEAARMAVDWRVKADVANAGTIVNCAIHTQEKSEAGKAKVETKAPVENEKRGD